MTVTKPASLPSFQQPTHHPKAKLSFSTVFLAKSNAQSLNQFLPLSSSIRSAQNLVGMAYAATVVPVSISFCGSRRQNVLPQKRRSLVVMSASAAQQFDLQLPSKKLDLSVMVCPKCIFRTKVSVPFGDAYLCLSNNLS